MYLGIILLIIGILFVLPKVSLFKILLGTGLILMGLSIYLNKDIKEFVGLNNVAIFSEKNFEFDENQNYYITIFGNTSLSVEKEKLLNNKKIKIINVFGNTRIEVDKSSNYKIDSVAILGSNNIPQNNKSKFGKFVFESQNFDNTKKYSEFLFFSIFGNLSLEEINRNSSVKYWF